MIRTITGSVVSNKGDKTAIVAVTRLKKHAVYNKRFRVTKKFVAHDPENVCEIGDTVTIQASRPLSKTKRWIVLPNEEAQS